MNLEQKLTKNFTLSEFVRSQTAVNNNIDNAALLEDEHVENLQKVADVLQSVRDCLNFPIYISSGFRCFRLNQLVGGVYASKHLKGLAADIYCSTLVELRRVYNLLSKHKKVQYLYLKRTRKSHYIHFQLYD